MNTDLSTCAEKYQTLCVLLKEQEKQSEIHYIAELIDGRKNRDGEKCCFFYPSTNQ